jgi:hypothetical protein
VPSHQLFLSYLPLAPLLMPLFFAKPAANRRFHPRLHLADAQSTSSRRSSSPQEESDAAVQTHEFAVLFCT